MIRSPSLSLSSCPVVGAGQTIHESLRNVKHIFEKFFSPLCKHRHKLLIFALVAKKYFFCTSIISRPRLSTVRAAQKTSTKPRRTQHTGFNLRIIKQLSKSKHLPNFISARLGYNKPPQHHTHSSKATPPGDSDIFKPTASSISASISIGSVSRFSRFSKQYMSGFFPAHSCA